MAWRRALSRALFAIGCLLLLGALALLVAARTLPYQGFEDLGRVVGAMLLAAMAGVPFAASLLLWDAPRAQTAIAALGCVVAAVPAVALMSVGVTQTVVIGLVLLVPAALGIYRAVARWRRGFVTER